MATWELTSLSFRNGGTVILPNTRSSFQCRRSAGNPGLSALGGSFQRQSASLISTPLRPLCPQTPRSLFWKFPGFFREPLLHAASQKGPPRTPPSHHHPLRLCVCLPPCLLAGPHVILKSLLLPHHPGLLLRNSHQHKIGCTILHIVFSDGSTFSRIVQNHLSL